MIRKNCFKVSCYAAFLLLASHSKLYSQVVKDFNDNTSQYTMAAPDVYTFEKYNLTTANHHVGKLDVSVPITTIKTGNIEYPLKLVYNTGGIKVDQLASNVGLGWSLSSALITRVINGGNDFDNTGSLAILPEVYSYSEEDRLADFDAFQDNNYSGKIGYMLQKRLDRRLDNMHRTVDFLPDQYNFYGSNYSTSFFFDNYNSVKEMTPKGTKIEYVIGERRLDARRGNYNYFHPGVWEPRYNLLSKDLMSIIITTNDGIKYTFSDLDFTLNQNLSNYLNTDSPPQVSAWHVTKIEDTKTGKKIDFVYETAYLNPNHFYLDGIQGGLSGFYTYGAQRTYQYVDNPEINIQPGGCSYYVPSTGSQSYQLNITARVDVELKRLKRIVYDEGQIVFNYNNEGVGSQNGTGRNDIYNGDYISQIYLKDLNLNTVKQFDLTYSTFTSAQTGNEFNPDNNAFNTFRYKRLKLTEVKEVGKPSYKFFYDETVNLPPINSFSIDFLGYYNGSTDIKTVELLRSTKSNPTLYYYPNQYEKSLLPFPIPGMSGLTIPGYFDRKANAYYAKAWSLNKIEYPTGGSAEYVYESNKFQILGQTIDGGGVRIAQQLLKDDNGNTRTVNYQYNNLSGISSGSLFSVPNFGMATTKLFDVTLDYPQDGSEPTLVTPNPSTIPTNIADWKLYDKSNLNADIASGSYVGYSYVSELEPGLGRKEYSFTSNNLTGFSNEIRIRPIYYAADIYSLPTTYNACFPQFLIANSGFGSEVFTNNSYKRGKLLEEKTYSNTNQLVKKITYQYTDNLINTYRFTQAFTQPLHVQSEENNVAPLVSGIKDYKIAQYLPYKQTVVSYNTTGNANTEVENYTYNQFGLIKSISNVSSIGDTNYTEYSYPDEIVDIYSLMGDPLTVSEKDNYISMVTANNVAENIQVSNFVNSTPISYARTTFAAFDGTTGILSPQSIKNAKGSNPLENKVTYDVYDDKKNLQQYTLNNASPVTLIWGYNKTKLIAKIENIALSGISNSVILNLQNLSNADFDNCISGTCNEQLLRNALNSLRTSLATTNPNAMMTTYTYDNLVGITSITDPKGDTEYYTYDNLERLVKVIDKNGNTRTESQYNYKP